MASVREVIFIRHGQTAWNAEGRLQGQADSPLTRRGRGQVLGHLPWLERHPPTRLLASPLGRTLATAELLAAPFALPIEQEPALRERGMGRFEGWTLEELHEREPAAAADRLRDPWHYRAPGGENYVDMQRRVVPLLDRLRKAPAQRLLLVSHGTIVRPMLGHLLALDPPTVLRIRQPNDLAYRVLLDEPEPRVIRWQAGEENSGLLLTPP